MPFRVNEIISRRFVKSLIYGFIKSNEFKQVRSYCMFIGYQRSGHSLIGALIDAHPNAAMGMEVDVLNLVRSGYGRNQIYYCLIRNAQIFRERLNNVWTDYSYHVPGQYQGTYKQLYVIGDKKGGKSTLRLGDDVALYDHLKDLLKCPVKVLHVIRHPMDNIATMVIRHISENSMPSRSEIKYRIDYYFDKVAINDRLRKSGELDVLDVYHEDFVAEPEKELVNILEHIGLDPIPDYISACSAIIRKEPRLSRYDFKWPDDLACVVKERAAQYDFLGRYEK